MSDAILGARVKTVFAAERGCYGAKRITAELKDQAGHDPVNHKRVARVMRELKLFGYDRRNARSPRPSQIRRNQCFLTLSAGNSLPINQTSFSRRGHHLPADCGWVEYISGHGH